MAYPNGYAYRVAISVDHTQCGSGGALPNFPVPFFGMPACATGPNGGYSHSGGLDVVFASDPAGASPLIFEQVAGSYNATTGAGEWHINAGTGPSQVNSVTDATIYAFIGKSGVSD